MKNAQKAVVYNMYRKTTGLKDPKRPVYRIHKEVKILRYGLRVNTRKHNRARWKAFRSVIKCVTAKWQWADLTTNEKRKMASYSGMLQRHQTLPKTKAAVLSFVGGICWVVQAAHHKAKPWIYNRRTTEVSSLFILARFSQCSQCV